MPIDFIGVRDKLISGYAMRLGGAFFEVFNKCFHFGCAKPLLPCGFLAGVSGYSLAAACGLHAVAGCLVGTGPRGTGVSGSTPWAQSWW